MVSENELREIARKTLCRDQNDLRPIPSHYLRHLRDLLSRSPREHHFLLDMEETTGILTCQDCWEVVVLGNNQPDDDGHFEFGGFNNFEKHIQSQEHKSAKAKNAQSSTPNPGMSTYPTTPQKTIPSDVHRSYPSSSTASSPNSVASSKRKRIVFPGGDVIEISDDENDIEATPNPKPTKKMKSEHQETSFPLSTKPYIPLTLVKREVPFKKRERVQFPDGEVIEISDDEENVVQPVPSSSKPFIPLKSASSSNGVAPKSTVPPPAINGVKKERDVKPNIRRERIVFPDGEVIEISGDEDGDEVMDEVPPQEDEEIVLLSPNTSRRLPPKAEPLHNTFANLHLQRPAIPPPAKQMKRIVFPDGEVIEISDDEIEEVGGQGTTPYPHRPQPVEDVDMPGAFPVAGPAYPRPQFQPQAQGQAPPGFIPANFLPPDVELAYNPQYFNGMGYVPRGDGTGFRINYNDEGPARRIDYGGPQHDEHLKDFFVSSMEKFWDAPTVMEAARNLKLKAVGDTIPGMEVSLLAHQLIGVDWMIQQEKTNKIEGGILADDMGLGKTVQTIATMVLNRPSRDPEENPDGRRSTLIIVPGALMQQWKDEIDSKTCDGLFRVHIHHGKDKLKNTQQVAKYDAVITTYHTLAQDFPKGKKSKKKGKGKAKQADPEYQEDADNSEEENEDDDIFEAETPSGPLAQTKWYRVILDEAQVVRNRTTRGSVNVALLDSKYRWALTGTPVTNTLADIYALVRFLRYRPWVDWKEFNSRIAKIQKSRPDLAGQRAQALLKKCLLRRTKLTQLEGKPLLQLGPKEIEIVPLDFSPDERKIYARVEAQQKVKMTKFLKAGTVMKNYSHILVMLLRLRQICNHPQLIAYAKPEAANGAEVEEDDGEDEEGGHNLEYTPESELKQASRLLGDQFIVETKAKFKERALARIAAEKSGEAMDDTDTDCPICMDPFTNNCRVTACGHLFCSTCITEVLKSPVRAEAGIGDQAFDQAMRDGTRPCPNCRQLISEKLIFRSSIFEPSDRELGIGAGPSDLHAEDEIDVLNSAIGENDFDLKKLDLGDEFVPSTKMVKLLELLKAWNEEAEDDKIICYSQWTSMIDLVQILLEREGIKTLRFDGKMSRLSRDETLVKFKKRGGPKFMLISLKCGGVGLNLTAANRVICLDLAWNAATENQAFDRVHRLGQQKPVVVKRLIIRDTIEDRILKLQATKQGLADAALGEGQGGKIRRMTVNELKALFGM